eukprot:COSAG02_NODE_712_length_18122_cov_6.792321_13_plen_204_part_00
MYMYVLVPLGRRIVHELRLPDTATSSHPHCVGTPGGGARDRGHTHAGSGRRRRTPYVRSTRRRAAYPYLDRRGARAVVARPTPAARARAAAAYMYVRTVYYIYRACAIPPRYGRTACRVARRRAGARRWQRDPQDIMIPWFRIPSTLVSRSEMMIAQSYPRIARARGALQVCKPKSPFGDSPGSCTHFSGVASVLSPSIAVLY